MEVGLRRRPGVGGGGKGGKTRGRKVQLGTLECHISGVVVKGGGIGKRLGNL